jgi:hypothetical protein
MQGRYTWVEVRGGGTQVSNTAGGLSPNEVRKAPGNYIYEIPGINGVQLEAPDERFKENISVPTEQSGS